MRARVAYPRSGGRCRRRGTLGVALLLILAMITGCSYSSSEPGLFQTQPPVDGSSAPNDFPPPSPFPPRPTNPDLPVAGDAVWTSSEGLRLTTRTAVHAVRRMAGATVLDWSLTPLDAPGLQPGQKVPSWVDLGLGKSTGGDVNALLLDAAAGRAYRPLQHTSRRRFNHCLCTPPWVAQLDLRIGETRLLQATFPALPAATRWVDVSLNTLPVFSRVPVTPDGQVPTATAPTDLRRFEDSPPLAPPYHLSEPDLGGARRVQSIQIDAVEAGSTFTSLRWTLRSLTDQPSVNVFPPGPPVTAAAPTTLPPVNPSTASGPQLRAAGRTLSAVHLSYAMLGRRYVDCLCTGFGLWATALRQAGGSASVTTVYPPLPPGTARVDVVLPGATTIWRLPVSAAFDGSARLGPPRAADLDRWLYREDQAPPGWGTADWPTPLPDPAQLRDYDALVERLLPSSSR